MSSGRKLFTSAKNWGCDEQQKLSMLLFVQRVRELLLHTTSMAAKPLVISPLVVAREILFILLQHTKTPHSSTEANIRMLVVELSLALSNDEVAKTVVGDRLSYIKNCLLNFDNNQLQVEAAQYLIGRFSIRQYTKNCADSIIQIIESDGKRKKDLLSLSESYVAAIKEAGYPTQTIYHLLNVSFFDHEKTSCSARQRLEKFFSNFDFEYHSYDVYFSLAEIAKNVKDTFLSVGANFYPSESEDAQKFLQEISSANKRFFCAHEYDGIVKLAGVRALDPQSARVVAEARLRMLDDLLRFSVHRRRFIVRNQALVLKEKTNQYVNSNRPRSPVLLVPHDSDNTHEGLMNLAAAMRRARSGSLERFGRALELHGTALSAQEEEAQLLNIWIALETLFVTGRSGSKVKEIIEAIEPYVLSSWNQYVMGEIWEKIEHVHMKKWNESIMDVDSLKDLPGLIQFVLSISVKEFEPSMTKFLGELDGDPLLRQKIFACIGWSQDAKSIKKYIDGVIEKVSNDINRIYRTRNQIVHTGGGKSGLGDVVQLAHYYLDLVLALISLMLGDENGCKTIEQANLEARIKSAELVSGINQAIKNDVKCNRDNYAELLFGRDLLA